jgi:hypothetical protein
VRLVVSIADISLIRNNPAILHFRKIYARTSVRTWLNSAPSSVISITLQRVAPAPLQPPEREVTLKQQNVT